MTGDGILFNTAIENAKVTNNQRVELRYLGICGSTPGMVNQHQPPHDGDRSRIGPRATLFLIQTAFCYCSDVTYRVPIRSWVTIGNGQPA